MVILKLVSVAAIALACDSHDHGHSMLPKSTLTSNENVHHHHDFDGCTGHSHQDEGHVHGSGCTGHSHQDEGHVHGSGCTGHSHQDEGHVHGSGCTGHDHHGHSHDHGSQDNADPKTDCLIAFIVLASTFLAAFIPFKFMTPKQRHGRTAQLLNVFASGSILGLCMVHILPEAVEKISPICGHAAAKSMTAFSFTLVIWRFLEDMMTSYGVMLPQFVSDRPCIESESEAPVPCCAHGDSDDSSCHAGSQDLSLVSVGHEHTASGGSLYLSIIGTSVHCFVEGAFIVISSKKWLTCFSIMLHKLIVAFSFGSKVALSDDGTGVISSRALFSLAIFLLSTPVSIVFVSLSASTFYRSESLAIVDWISAGLVLTLATNSLFQNNISTSCKNIIVMHYGIMTLALTIVSALVVLMPHEH